MPDQHGEPSPLNSNQCPPAELDLQSQFSSTRLLYSFGAPFGGIPLVSAATLSVVPGSKSAVLEHDQNPTKIFFSLFLF